MASSVEIVIAEDSPTQRLHLQMILEDRGYAVRAMPDGEAALAAIRERQPTLVVSDVNMPKLDGYGLCQAIKNDDTLKHVPVVLVTDLSGTSAILRGLECGADNFFTKPFDETHLLARLDYILANRRIREQDKFQLGVEVSMAGRRHFITAERQQILDLLVSSYEEAVHLSDRLRAQQLEIQRAYQNAQALYCIADALNRCRTLKEVVDRLLTEATAFPGITGGWLMLGDSPKTMRLVGSQGAPVALGRDPISSCECRQRVLGADAVSSGVILDCSMLRAAGAKGGHATIPLYTQGTPIGILNLLGEEEASFDTQKLDMLSALGSLAATAIGRAGLHDQLEARVKARTAALLDSEERFRDFADAASDWFWETDANFNYTSFLERGTQSLGIGLKEIVGHLRSEMIPPELLAETGDAHQAFRDHVIRWQRGDGEVLHVRSNGKPVFGADGKFLGYRGTGRDVTAEVKAAEALRESEARLATVAENVPGVLFQRAEDAGGKGSYPYISPRIRDILGCRPEDIQSEPKILLELLNEEFADQLFGALKRSAETGDAVEVEGAAATRTGEERWLRAHFRFRPDGAGTKIWDGLLLDVTEEHRLKGRQRTLEHQLSQAQKMEAIGNLTGGMAHDFNNILTIIMGNLEALAEIKLPTDAAGMVEESIDSCMRAAELTRQLLAFARRQPLEPKLVDVNHAVTAMAKLLGRTLGEDIKVAVEPGEGLWQVLVDPAQLESAIANLSVNARDAMPDGGTLTISTRNAVLDRDYVLLNPDAQPGDYVCVDVEDTGSGIPPEIMSRIFEPFFTTKEVGKGTGLGLAMIFGFVKQSGGHIQAYSEVGHGTTMRLYLPRAADTEGVESVSTATQEVPRANAHERILVVEDHEQIRRHVVDRLKMLGYQVIEAANGTDALAMFDRGHKVDLLFTDVVMPGGLNGYELYQEAATRQPGLPVLFTSGFSGPALGRAGALAANHALLTKPYQATELARKIRQVLDKAAPP